MPDKVLNDDWTDYDNKKITGKADAKNFACTEPWEVDYLASKIRRLYPQYTSELIRTAIKECCKIIGAPHPRKTFVKCVMERLGAE